MAKQALNQLAQKIKESARKHQHCQLWQMPITGQMYRFHHKTCLDWVLDPVEELAGLDLLAQTADHPTLKSLLPNPSKSKQSRDTKT